MLLKEARIRIDLHHKNIRIFILFHDVWRNEENADFLTPIVSGIHKQQPIQVKW